MSSITVLIQMGVINTPSRLEILALKIAAGKLPPAMDTITTEEETVEGKAHKNKIPTHSRSPSADIKNGLSPKAISGNNRKVAPCTTRCSFQLVSPAFRSA